MHKWIIVYAPCSCIKLKGKKPRRYCFENKNGMLTSPRFRVVKNNKKKSWVNFNAPFNFQVSKMLNLYRKQHCHQGPRNRVVLVSIQSRTVWTTYRKSLMQCKKVYN